MDRRTMFYSAVLFGLKTKVCPKSCETAAVDGHTLFINPEWFSKLDLPQAVGLLAHEVNHVIFEHLERGQSYDPKIYNYAADYKNNGILDNAGILLPPNPLLDHKYDDYTLLQVYDELMVTQPDYPDVPMDIIQYDPSQDLAKTIQIKVLMTQAAESTKAAGGAVPKEVERMIAEMHSPAINWESELMEYMEEEFPSDFSWDKLNLAYFPKLRLPSLTGTALGEIAFAVDSSSSVTDEEFSSFIASITDCREKLMPEKTTIIDFTTQINTVHTFNAYDDLSSVSFRGYGGTSLSPVFEYFKENSPNILVVFSDLECWPEEEMPDYPVVWICINNPYARVNFGKLIHYSI